MGPAVLAAFAAALGDNIILRDPAVVRLIAMVSHDLATPSALIRSTIEIARHAGPGAAVEMDRMWVRLDTAATRATSLIRTLGDARTLDSGELNLDLRPADVRHLIAPVVPK
jgi:signal transduction histidine kinase